MNEARKTEHSKRDLERTRIVLADLISAVTLAMETMDEIYRKPVSEERGREIGQVMNLLQRAAQAAQMELPNANPNPKHN